MHINRRLFIAGTAAAAGAARAATTSAQGATPAQRQVIDMAAGYLEAHRRHWGLPAMGLVLVAGDRQFLVQSGSRDFAGAQPLAGDELWQIGSISKSFVAAIILMLEAEGKVQLGDELGRHLPEARLPGVASGGPFTLRGLLDHTTGLPDFAPALAADGSRLWRGFPAGSQWHYSNTGYDLLGKAIERIEGKPLWQVIEERIARPLGMAATRGAIQWRDRARFPASFAPLRPDLPVVRPTPLAPAPWVDAALGAGSVASTLTDMARWLRYLIAVGAGQGAPLLPDALAAQWLARPVPQDTDGNDLYGLGLMHRSDDGRALLHHTGGMVSFSSSFHVDAAAGTGAFASCAVGGLGYRPRLITLWATHALRAAAEGKAIPNPPPLEAPFPDAAKLVGTYTDGADSLTVDAGMTISHAGRSAPLQHSGGPAFVTAHPALAEWPLVAVRQGETIVALDHGRRRFAKAGASAPLGDTPAELLPLQGWYQSDDPWSGGFAIVARGTRLWLNGSDPLIGLGRDEWKPAEPEWSPERLRFTAFVDGVPQIALLSGRAYERRDR